MTTDIHVSKLVVMKNKILKIAEQQLMGGGYDKLNFATIAKELRTTRANLHYHFKNKESLAIEVARDYGIRNINELKSLREAFDRNFFGFFKAIDNSFWDHEDDMDKTRFCTMLTTDPDLPDSLVKLSLQFYNKTEKLYVDIIQDAIDNGVIRDTIDAKREATRVHVIVIGLMTCGQHLSKSELPTEQLSGLLVDWVNSLK